MKKATLKTVAAIGPLPGPHQTGSEKGTDKANVFVGTNFADRFDGTNGSDRIYGGNGSDVLEGGNGKDTLYGGNGDDILRGGTGNDTFVFMNAAEAGKSLLSDRITDFTTGADKIDLHNFMAGGHFIGTAALVVGGGAQVSYDKAKSMLVGDVNGDGVVDFNIRLNSTPVIAETDFIF